ncbi:MAG TPA: hypothetical protein VF992_00365 [Thermoplasmata archaeon]
MVGKMARKSTMRRVRQGKRRPRESGFLVTWDVDSSDAATAARLRRFVYGDTSVHGGKVYRRPGFAERDGVRYLGQSVLFVRPSLLGDIQAFLESHRIDHEITSAAIG